MNWAFATRLALLILSLLIQKQLINFKLQLTYRDANERMETEWWKIDQKEINKFMGLFALQKGSRSLFIVWTDSFLSTWLNNHELIIKWYMTNWSRSTALELDEKIKSELNFGTGYSDDNINRLWTWLSLLSWNLVTLNSSYIFYILNFNKIDFLIFTKLR